VRRLTFISSRVNLHQPLSVQQTRVWMTTKSAFPALYALISPAWERGSPRVEDLALPKSLKSGNFTLAKAVIRWMSVKYHSKGEAYA